MRTQLSFPVTRSLPVGQSDALSRFLAESPCPFAQSADVVPLGPWQDPFLDGPRLDALRAELSAFVGNTRSDLAILEMGNASTLHSLESWGSWLHGLLRGLRDRDATTAEPLPTWTADRDWDFHFENLAFFLSLFAPLYPTTHSRHSGDKSTAFLLLQPERGFRHFGVSSGLPARQRLSKAVHGRFARHGKHYDLDNNLYSPKALRYIKPLRPGDPEIAWWRCDHPFNPGGAGGSADPL